MRLVKELQRQGFDVVRTGSGHWKVTRSGYHGCVIMSFSPRTSGMHKTRKQLRELGYQE
jgi:predicted RNA binding protein YcfA (HicA-like mRNA interferase family)